MAATEHRRAFVLDRLSPDWGPENKAKIEANLDRAYKILRGIGGVSVGMGSVGNTGGTSGYVDAQLMLVGTGALTLSQSWSSDSATLTLSAGGGAAVGMSTLGNTSGTSAVYNSGSVVLVGGNNITLSGSTGTGGVTITVSAFTQSLQSQAFELSFFDNMPGVQVQTMGHSNSTLKIFPLFPSMQPFPGDMTARTIMLDVSHQMGNVGSKGHSSTWWAGFYTLQTATSTSTYSSIGSGTSYTLTTHQLNLLYMASSVWSASQSSSINGSSITRGPDQAIHGVRFVTFHSTQFSDSNSNSVSNLVFKAGSFYWFGGLSLSNTTGYDGSGAMRGQSGLGGAGATVQRLGTFGFYTLAGDPAATRQQEPYFGTYSATTLVLPTRISMSELRGTNVFAQFQQRIVFNNMMNQWPLEASSGTGWQRSDGLQFATSS